MMELKFEGGDDKVDLIPYEGIKVFLNQDHLFSFQQINTHYNILLLK